jgi:hypothetical protein
MKSDANTPEEREKLVKDFQMIMDIFTINSYCLSIDVSEIKSPVAASAANQALNLNSESFSPMTLKILVRAPSNLWSDQALRKRKENPINDFEIKVLRALAKRWGYQLETISTNVMNKIDVVHVVRITR